MPASIGSASPGQFPDILSFWRVATIVPSSTDDLRGLEVLYAHDPDAIVVATEEGAIVGTIIAAWDGWRAGMYRVAVRPSHRGRGIGRALVAEGEARLRRRGARRVSLFAVEAHQGAVSFWHALGYRPDHDDLRFVRDL
jgi:ribosomal protein S18 acetylase RimI-like enzyme